jgi:hypothetical protein
VPSGHGKEFALVERWSMVPADLWLFAWARAVVPPLLDDGWAWLRAGGWASTRPWVHFPFRRQNLHGDVVHDCRVAAVQHDSDEAHSPARARRQPGSIVILLFVPPAAAAAPIRPVDTANEGGTWEGPVGPRLVCHGWPATATSGPAEAV